MDLQDPHARLCSPVSPRSSGRWLAWLFAPLLSILPAQALPTPEADLFRLSAGIKIFQAFLAADLELRRRADPDGYLNVLVIDGEGAGSGETVATLNDAPEVQGLKLHARAVTLNEYPAAAAAGPVAAVFVARKLFGELPRLLAVTGPGCVPVFSPFPGDVAAGATAGLNVADRIVPTVNRRELARCDMQLKPFFLKVASSP